MIDNMSDPIDMTDIDDLNDSVDRILYASRAQVGMDILSESVANMFEELCEEFPGLEKEWERRSKEDPDIGFLDVAAEMEERRNKK